MSFKDDDMSHHMWHLHCDFCDKDWEIVETVGKTRTYYCMECYNSIRRGRQHG